VRASVFRQVGGYRDVALLEDLDFSQRLKRAGRTVLIRVPLLTSGRRFLARGPSDAPPGSQWPRHTAPRPEPRR
jgi:hypothetical protein